MILIFVIEYDEDLLEAMGLRIEEAWSAEAKNQVNL